MNQESGKPQTRTSSVQGKYIYCIIEEKRPARFHILGQQEKEVYCISSGDLAAVVSDSDRKDYSLIREYLLAHQRVIEEVMRDGYDVLPVRFGTVGESAEVIREKILKGKKKELQETLKIVEGKVELGLRALWENMGDICEEIVQERSDIQRAKKEAEKNPNRLKVAYVGELIARALERKREDEEEKILRPLTKIAADFKERQRMGDSMILSFAFLVLKKNEKAFDREVSELRRACGARIRFLYIGPIPPFNFVELQLDI